MQKKIIKAYLELTKDHVKAPKGEVVSIIRWENKPEWKGWIPAQYHELPHLVPNPRF